jgi:hypothetical protein
LLVSGVAEKGISFLFIQLLISCCFLPNTNNGSEKNIFILNNKLQLTNRSAACVSLVYDWTRAALPGRT